MIKFRMKILLVCLILFLTCPWRMDASDLTTTTEWDSIRIGYEHPQRVNLDMLTNLLTNRPPDAPVTEPPMFPRTSLADLFSIKIGHDVFPLPLHDDRELIGAEIGIGFPVLPHTSLRAAFSMVRLNPGGLRQEREALAEAGFVLEF